MVVSVQKVINKMETTANALMVSTILKMFVMIAAKLITAILAVKQTSAINALRLSLLMKMELVFVMMTALSLKKILVFVLILQLNTIIPVFLVI